jgi:hypothetical protein
MPLGKESLLAVLPCPIMDTDESIHFTLGQELLKAAILKSFEGNPIPINKLRDRYTALWDAYWVKTHGKPAESSTGPYWAGPKMSITIANKILTFLNEYEIISPTQPYSYVLETYLIEGSSCIVRKKSTSKKARSYFTVMVKEEVNEYTAQPDTLALTRWYNVESNYAGVLPSGILYVPLIKGKIKQLFIKDIKLAKDWILNAFNSKRNKFPIAGTHCKTCKSRNCEKVLNVGQNEDPRIRRLREISSHR